MAIINHFPMEDSELYQIYEHPEVFPAVFSSTSHRYITSQNGYLYAISDSNTDSYKECSFTIYPVRQVYIKPTSGDRRYQTSSYGQPVVLKPGHEYYFYRRSYSDSISGQDRYLIREDGIAIVDVETNMLSHTDLMFLWQLTPYDE